MSCSSGHLGFRIDNKKLTFCKSPFNDYSGTVWAHSSF